ncbi:MAG: hypothetical protein JST16_06705 [Bdellovibrionales bacterium]|nr:hypothetical protein [Bdellovibrionales bacterium]
MRTSKSISCSVTLILSALSACKVADNEHSPNATPQESTTTTYAGFSSMQYAISNISAFREALSGFSGAAYVTTPNYPLDVYLHPPFGCDYASNYSPKNASLIRYLDFGKLAIKGDSVAAQDVPRDKSAPFFSLGVLFQMPGNYEISTSGSNLVWSQSFQTVGYGGNFKIRRLTDGVSFNLPTPNAYMPGETGFVNAVLSKADGAVISFDTPANTSYVRAEFKDGSQASEGDVVCFGPPNQDITVPAGAFARMMSTQQGLLTVDFVSVSIKNDIPNFGTSFVLSSTRHVHGRMDLNLQDGKHEFYLGALTFASPE